MKRIIALIIIIGVAWLMYKFPYTMMNPGELVEEHQEEKNNCFSCHDPFWGISSEKCISCHALSDIGKSTISINDSLFTSNENISFHQNFKNQPCTSCHIDHKGTNPSMAISKFSHELLAATELNSCNSCHKTPPNNLHQQLSANCNNCHTTNDWKSTKNFDHSMLLGKSKDNCVSCHQPPSDSFHQQNKNNCNQCHFTTKWSPSSFDHKKYFRFDKHHNTDCKTCHANNNYTTYTCYNCHEHSLNKIKNEHLEEGIYQFENCAECHKSANEDEAERTWKSTKGGMNKKLVKESNKNDGDDDEHKDHD